MRKILMAVAAMAAALMAASCAEQSPDSYLPPEFGPVEVSLNGFRATAQCKVTGPEDGFSYGFVLQEGSGAQPQEIALKPSEGVLSNVFEELTPSTDYIIKAFATNGINTVTSAEGHFRTEDGGQYVSLPDPNFKALILSKYDSDDDGQLSLEEAESISVIECCSDDFRSIEGVEFFTNLERITCRGSGTENDRRTGKLTKADLRKNTRLRYVEFDGNNLTELLLPETSSNIEEVHCIVNKLETLDLSGCPKLRILWCWNNNLTSINIVKCQYLTDLRCSQNDFSNGLDVSGNKELRYLYCNDDNLQSLDVSANTELIELCCWNNFTKHIDVSNNTKLFRLDCANNMLSNIDVSKLKDLEILTIENNYLKEIDLSHNTKLRELYCSANNFTELNIRMLTRLEELSLNDNKISEPLDLSCFPELKHYSGNNLPLNCVPDFSHNPKLNSIHFSGSGGAIYMDKDFFRDWPEIQDFNINGYPGETIDLSRNTKMRSLWIASMPNIKVLDLSASPYLSYICINDDDRLEKVYVHKNVDISRLNVESNDRFHGTIEHKP